MCRKSFNAGAGPLGFVLVIAAVGLMVAAQGCSPAQQPVDGTKAAKLESMLNEIHVNSKDPEDLPRSRQQLEQARAMAHKEMVKTVFDGLEHQEARLEFLREFQSKVRDVEHSIQEASRVVGLDGAVSMGTAEVVHALDFQFEARRGGPDRRREIST